MEGAFWTQLHLYLCSAFALCQLLPLASSLNEDVKAVPVLSFAVSKRVSLFCF